MVKTSKQSILNERDQLITDHLWLVEALANRLKATLLFSADREELISSGNFALVKAAMRFERRNGCQFKTYAFDCIRGQMIQDFTRLDGHHLSAVTWNDLVKSTDDVDLNEEAWFEPDLAEEVYKTEIAMKLSTALQKLARHHLSVVRAFYIEEIPLRVYARDLGLKYHRVAKWKRTAIKHLRESIKATV